METVLLWRRCKFCYLYVNKFCERNE